MVSLWSLIISLASFILPSSLVLIYLSSSERSSFNTSSFFPICLVKSFSLSSKHSTFLFKVPFYSSSWVCLSFISLNIAYFFVISFEFLFSFYSSSWLKVISIFNSLMISSFYLHYFLRPVARSRLLFTSAWLSDIYAWSLRIMARQPFSSASILSIFYSYCLTALELSYWVCSCFCLPLISTTNILSLYNSCCNDNLRLSSLAITYLSCS